MSLRDGRILPQRATGTGRSAWYGFAVQPTVAFYFRVPPETAIGRLLEGRDGFKFYEAGMDLDLSDDPEESFRYFRIGSSRNTKR